MQPKGKQKAAKMLLAHAVIADFQAQGNLSDSLLMTTFLAFLTMIPFWKTSQDGLSKEIGKAFRAVEASEKKAVSSENRIRSIRLFLIICC